MSGALQSTGATLWYMYDNHVGPSGNQVALLRATEPYDPAEFTRRARAAPGGVWMFGNEPNTGGQDDISPEGFAQFVSWAVGFIRAADPTAILVGPGVLNWDATCTGCAGMRSGHSWSDEFLTVYQQRYGPLPFNAWSLHAYTIDWTHLPMLNAEQDKAQITATRAWLDSKGLNLPIWITELGVIYGYEGLQWVQQNDGTAKAVPQGRFRSDLIAAYLDQMLDWLVRNSSTLRIDRWFLYCLAPITEPWSTVPVGMALLEPDLRSPSAFGQQYRNWALRSPPGPPSPTATPGTPTPPAPTLCTPRPSVGVAVVAAGTGQLHVTISAGRPGVTLTKLSFGAATSALLDVGAQVGATGPFAVSLAPGTTQTSFTVRQASAGQAMTVPLTVTDTCGDWPTFVGAGPNAVGVAAVPSPPTAAPTATPPGGLVMAPGPPAVAPVAAIPTPRGPLTPRGGAAGGTLAQPSAPPVPAPQGMYPYYEEPRPWERWELWWPWWWWLFR